MGMQIDFIASNEVMEAIVSMGRTEDVKFSPDNRRLAIAGFVENKCLVIDIKIEISSVRKKIVLSDFIEITSSCLDEPHGLTYIDQETLIVANRSGTVNILKIPPSGMGKTIFDVSPLQTIYGSFFYPLNTPGSVSVSPLDNDLYEVLICNNFINRVTRHVLDGSREFRVMSNEILLQNQLDVPDGVAVNPDHHWIAISNHFTHSILLFENTKQLDRHSGAAGVLRNANYPHGVRFTPDDNFVLVADAGAPFVHVYARGDSSWDGMRDPVTSVRVMDAETYSRGRCTPEEGGPKGIDIDSEMNVMVTTCEHQPLVFFDLSAVLNSSQPAFSSSMPE